MRKPPYNDGNSPMTTLIVTLSPPGMPHNELAYALANNAQALSNHGSAPLALLPRADETVLLLPSDSVSWHRVSLPKLSRSLSAPKLRSVLEGAIEEHLLDDATAVHIASYRAAGSADSAMSWLAVCDKSWLLAHLRSLQNAGHRISRIVPGAFPLDLQQPNANQTVTNGQARAHVSGTPEAAIVTLADNTGVVSVPLHHARTVWPALHTDTLITAEPAVAAAAENIFNTKVTMVQTAQYALQAAQEARSYGVDLAQGELAVKGRGRWLQQASTLLRDLVAAPAWRAARIGLALMLLVNIVGLNAWAWKERSALQTKRLQTSQLLTQTFPNVKAVVDAPLQMQREVAALRQASGAIGSRDMESMYARYSTIVTTGSAPTAIEFVAGELTLKGSGLDASQLSAHQAKLRSAGLLAVRSEDGRIVVTEAAIQRAGVVQ
jgi:general secretion pathway protein L